MSQNDLTNKVFKNYEKIKSKLKQYSIEAYRLYERDIPEYPFIIDIYNDYALIYDRREEIDFKDESVDKLTMATHAVLSALKMDQNKIIIKQRKRQKGLDQYEKIDEQKKIITVQESQAKFLINLTDYLDTGLFLDHRIMRQKIYKQSQGKKFLNLFSYTCSVSVFAALGGAHTTSVDMSNTYIDWGKGNFKLNAIDPNKHNFVTDNVIEYLSKPSQEKFDLIFLDPPTFSNSKKMDNTFEVVRDQDFLIEQCFARLSLSGILYFSNNKRDFKLSDKIKSTYKFRDITRDTIPFDFRDQKIHRVYEFRRQ